MGHFERCITLWMYALDMQQKILEPLSPMTQSSLLSFAELFSFMMSEGGRSRGQVRPNKDVLWPGCSFAGALCQPRRRSESCGGFADQREHEPVKSASSQLCRYHDGALSLKTLMIISISTAFTKRFFLFLYVWNSQDAHSWLPRCSSEPCVRWRPGRLPWRPARGGAATPPTSTAPSSSSSTLSAFSPSSYHTWRRRRWVKFEVVMVVLDKHCESLSFHFSYATFMSRA